MRRLAILAAVGATALVVATAVAAAPNSAATTIGTPTAGSTLDVTFTVFGSTPVVPYEYAIQNTCVYPPKTFGHYTLGQRDDIVQWTDTDAFGNPRVTMPVYLQAVPAGSTCKVSLMDNNTVVKGSTVSYTVS
jgi:hypothetical protein